MKSSLSPDSLTTVVSINIGYKIKDDLSMVEQRVDYLIFDSKTKEIIWINKNYNPSFETKLEVLNMLKK
jgi:hypothetical protein